MSERRRVSSRKVRVRQPASPADIRRQLTKNYSARQVEWAQQLDNEKIDWIQLLSLHLQMSELEHLEEALEDFA